jgi:hypothetical protein
MLTDKFKQQPSYAASEAFTMSENRQQRVHGLLAFVAIGLALVLFVGLMLSGASLAGHGNAPFVAILPLLLLGILSPLMLLGILTSTYAGRIPQAPLLAFAFERPPPTRRS